MSDRDGKVQVGKGIGIMEPTTIAFIIGMINLFIIHIIVDIMLMMIHTIKNKGFLSISTRLYGNGVLSPAHPSTFFIPVKPIIFCESLC